MSKSISVIAGNGELPIKVLRNICKLGIKADVIGIKGEYDKEIIKYSSRFDCIQFYEINKGIDILKRFGNKEVVLVGGVSKLRFLNIFSPQFIKSLFNIRYLSDENIFKGVIALIERYGFNVVNFSKFYKEGIAKEGVICGDPASERLLKDAIYGMSFIKSNSNYSIGQSVIVKNENIIAVETVLGTDQMLRSYRNSVIKDSVFVKSSKEEQDIRVDMPSIGRKTIELLDKVGIRWVFLEAEKSVIIGDIDTLNYAKKKDINICGIKSK